MLIKIYRILNRGRLEKFKIKSNHFGLPSVDFQINSGVSGNFFNCVLQAFDKLFANAPAIPMTPYSPIPRAPYGPSIRGVSTKSTTYSGISLARNVSYVRN